LLQLKALFHGERRKKNAAEKRSRRAGMQKGAKAEAGEREAVTAAHNSCSCAGPAPPAQETAMFSRACSRNIPAVNAAF